MVPPSVNLFVKDCCRRLPDPLPTMHPFKTNSLHYVKIDKSLRFIIDSFAFPDQCRSNRPCSGFFVLKW